MNSQIQAKKYSYFLMAPADSYTREKCHGAQGSYACSYPHTQAGCRTETYTSFKGDLSERHLQQTSHRVWLQKGLDLIFTFLRAYNTAFLGHHS